MANVQRDLAKERGWREVVERQASSGLSVRGFCRREGLSEASFYAWRRTIARRDGESSMPAPTASPPASPPPFLPVVVGERPTGEASIAIELAGGRVLRLPASTPAAWVADFVIALEAGACR